MTEPNPNPTGQAPKEPTPGEIADEMRMLGMNLVSALRSAWESEERRKVQQEIQNALSDLSATLNEAAGEFKESPTGQRLRGDVQDLRQRVRNGELENNIRQEIVNALRMVNQELEKARRKNPPSTPSDPGDNPPPPPVV